MNVGERFLDYAEDRNLHFTGKPPKILGYRDLDSYWASLHKSLDVPLDRGNDSHVVKRGRMQQLREAANVVQEVVN